MRILESFVYKVDLFHGPMEVATKGKMKIPSTECCTTYHLEVGMVVREILMKEMK